MPDSRKARRIADPGLQEPYITGVVSYLLRRVDGVGYQTQLAPVRGMLFWISIGILAIVALILWHYTRNRNLMDVTNSDFSISRSP